MYKYNTARSLYVRERDPHKVIMYTLKTGGESGPCCVCAYGVKYLKVYTALPVASPPELNAGMCAEYSYSVDADPQGSIMCVLCERANHNRKGTYNWFRMILAIGAYSLCQLIQILHYTYTLLWLRMVRIKPRRLS